MECIFLHKFIDNEVFFSQFLAKKTGLTVLHKPWFMRRSFRLQNIGENGFIFPGGIIASFPRNVARCRSLFSLVQSDTDCKQPDLLDLPDLLGSPP
jgi:hypothetical protein